MMRLFFNKKFYTYERIVFPIELVESKADIVRYMRYKDSNLLGFHESEISWTPITDLTQPYEVIFQQFDRKLRNQVKRAYKENIAFLQYDNLNVINDIEKLQDVCNKYYEFCDNYNLSDLKRNLDFDEFLVYVKSGHIVISSADYDGGWVYHIYQCDGKHALLWFSFSDYRSQKNKQLPGWANRGLHDSDIKFFKSKGYIEYDWGNVSSPDHLNNIDKFKMSFGGTLVPVYSSFIGNSLRGKTLIWLRSFKNTFLSKE